MKKLWPLFLILLVGFAPLQAQFQSGKLFVKLKSDSQLVLQQFQDGQAMPAYPDLPDVERILQGCHATALYKPFKTQSPQVQRIYELHFDPTADVGLMIEAWQRLPYIEYAEQVPLYEMHFTPDDYSIQLWGLFKIDAGAAWDICQGSRRVTVGIVDDAMLIAHEDLAPQVWTNPGEIAGDSIDNEGNGWIDDVHGYDIADRDNDPNPPSGADDNLFSHGTHTSGIAGAATNNGIGMASIGFNVSIVPIKTKEDSTIGDPYLYATYTGVDYAIANHFDVVNMSFGSSQYNFSMAYLIQAGHDSGTVFIASAGNTGTYAVQYPAAYDGVISVGSTDFSDSKSGFSTWHYSIDVMAPGSGIYSTVAGGTDHYGFKSGTSMSAPMVSGLAALMLSADSTLTPEDIRNCLQSSADNIDGLNAAYLTNIGAGRINAGRALLCVVPTTLKPQLSEGALLERIFPNPVTDRALFAADLPHDGTLRIRVTDMQGRQVGPVQETEAQAGQFQTWWQRPLGTAAGLYAVMWEWDGKVGAQKMILR